jgi:RimJ/RimL family protein N-acetyltransferase
MVMARCGMTLEGILRRSGVSNAGVGDMAWYGILREEWERSQGATGVLRPMDE